MVPDVAEAEAAPLAELNDAATEDAAEALEAEAETEPVVSEAEMADAAEERDAPVEDSVEDVPVDPDDFGVVTGTGITVVPEELSPEVEIVPVPERVSEPLVTDTGITVVPCAPDTVLDVTLAADAPEVVADPA